jgi:two-component system response regulator QseB
LDLQLNEQLSVRYAAFEGGPHSQADARRPPRSILVADDDPDIVNALALLLTGEGYAVRTAPDGNSAIDAALNEPVDLIICDLSMPYIDGRLVIERLRRDGVQTPAILMSAADRIQSLAGVQFVAKPFDVDRLLELVERLLNGRRTDGWSG